MSVNPRILAGSALVLGVVVSAAVISVLIGGQVMDRSTADATPSPAIGTLAPTTAPRSDWAHGLVGAPVTGVRGMAELRGRLYAWGREKGAAMWVSADGTNWMAADVSSAGTGGGYISGIVELDGRLYAWGRAGESDAGLWQPGIWVSDDGDRWTATNFPEIHVKHAYTVGVVDAGDRLIALVTYGELFLGHTGENRPTGTLTYASADGGTWEQLTTTPPADSGPHGILLKVEGKVLALGTDVWSSADGGRSWAVTTSAEELGGRMMFAEQQDGVITVGGRDDIHCRPGVEACPYFTWTSTDGGDTWKRRDGIGCCVAGFGEVGPGGRILTMGGGAPPIAVWTSDDQGNSWQKTTPSTSVYHVNAFTAVPGGFVAVGVTFPDTSPQSIIMTSPDGLAWTDHEVDFPADDILWTPTFGAVISGSCGDRFLEWCVHLPPDGFPVAGAR